MQRAPSRLNKFLLAFRAAGVIVALTGAVGLGWAYDFEGPRDRVGTDGQGYHVDLMGCITLTLSGAWCLVVLVLACVTGRIHPGVIIGVDVVLWLLTFAVGVVTASHPISRISRLDCSGPQAIERLCRQDHDNTVIWRIVGSAFCILNSIFHALTFINACSVCHQRRKAKRDYNDIELKG